MLILLYSDTNYVLDGFKAEFYVSNCPNNCTNRGKCIGHQCVCLGDWIGKDCSLHACPDNCGASEGRGFCLKEHCRCLNVSAAIMILSYANTKFNFKYILGLFWQSM